MPLFTTKQSKSSSSAGQSSNQSSSNLSSLSLSQQEAANQRYQAQIQAQSDDDRPPQARRPTNNPTRSPSHRHSSNLSLERAVNVPPQSVNPAEINNPTLGQAGPADHRHSYHPPPPQQAPEGAQKGEKRSIRSRIFGSSHKDAPPPPDEHRRLQKGDGVGRRASVRISELSPGGRYQSGPEDQQRITQQQGWQQKQDQNVYAERDEEVDPALQQGEQPAPHNQGVHLGYQQQHPQHPEQYRYQDRPALARVNTNPNEYSQHADQKHQSPEHHSGSSGSAQNSAQYPQPYINYPQQGTQQQLPGPPAGPYQAYSQPPGQQGGHGVAQSPDGSIQAYNPQLQQQDNSQFQPSPSQPNAPEFHHHQSVRRSHPLPPPPAGPEQSQSQGNPAFAQQQPPQNVQHLQPARPPSQQQFIPPSPASAQYQNYEQGGSDSDLASQSPSQQDTMPPPGPQRGLRPSDPNQKLPGPPPRDSSLQGLQAPQGHGQAPVSPGVQSFPGGVLPQQAQGQPPRAVGKAGAQLQDAESGRSTPPPPRSAQDMTHEEVEKLQQDYETLQTKYHKVKRYFFDQQSQVHQLQNTLANQRMSMSRTSLDDSEYATRFNRLDGLIAQLAHSIRKHWKSIPQWMQVSVNKEAITIGAKEMIIVGRSFIANWLAEEVFDKYFHPDLESSLSIQLKSVQQNIRRFSPPLQSTEEEEALWAKIINWRMATLEGLADVLRSPQAQSNKQKLTEMLVEKLIASLEIYLGDEATPDLKGNVPMIIDLVVGLLTHMPMESREVHIEYYQPGYPLMPDFMKIESGIAPLTNPCIESEIAGKISTSSDADDAKDLALEHEQAQGEKKSRGILGGLMSGNKRGPAPPQQGRQVAAGPGGGSQVSLGQQRPGSSNGPKEEQPQRVRLAGGLAASIRGRSVLFKAPVYAV